MYIYTIVLNRLTRAHRFELIMCHALQHDSRPALY